MGSNNLKFKNNDFRSLSLRSRFILLFGLMLALIIFGARAIPRALDSSMDFKPIYLASAAWVKGLNPYNHKILDNLWVEMGNSIATAPGLSSLYPITSCSIFSILTIFSWQNAKIILIFINIFAGILIWLGLIKMLEFNVTDWPSILLISAFLALSPVQNCIIQGQPVLVVLCLVMFSILVSRYGHDILSGTLLGLSLGIKPQIGLFFLAYYLIKKRWLIVASTAGVTVIIVILAISRLGFEDLSWLSSWQKNMQSASLAINRPSNPNRYFLLNIQYPLNTLLGNEYLVNAIIILLMSVYFMLFYLYCCKSSDSYQNLLEISFIAAISLLPFYHRNYEAAILIFPISYGILMTSLKADKSAKIILLLMCPFLIPGPAFLVELGKQGYVPAALADSLFWRTIILPHQVWLLFILSLLLILRMYRNSLR